MNLSVNNRKSEKEMSRNFLKTVNVKNLANESFSLSKKRLNTRSSKMKRRSVKLQSVRLRSRDSARRKPIVRNKRRQSRQGRWNTKEKWRPR